MFLEIYPFYLKISCRYLIFIVRYHAGRRYLLFIVGYHAGTYFSLSDITLLVSLNTTISTESLLHPRSGTLPAGLQCQLLNENAGTSYNDGGGTVFETGRSSFFRCFILRIRDSRSWYVLVSRVTVLPSRSSTRQNSSTLVELGKRMILREAPSFDLTHTYSLTSYNIIEKYQTWSVFPQNQEPTETSKQPIRNPSLGHVTGYQPIRDQYFLIRSLFPLLHLRDTRSPALWFPILIYQDQITTGKVAVLDTQDVLQGYTFQDHKLNTTRHPEGGGGGKV
eukprot:sb/3467934/